MDKINNCKLFESPVMRQVTGETIRPGGFFLTEQALKFCQLPMAARVLDVGCGSGQTVEYLREQFQLDAVGLDPSELLLAAGKERNSNLPLFRGQGEDLPFATASMDAVFAECTFSLMTDLEQTLQEIYRVLKPAGYLIVNDLYLKNQADITALQQLNMTTCLQGAITKEALLGQLTAHNFELVIWEEHSQLLRELAAKIVWTYGSMNNFWEQATDGTVHPLQTQSAIAKAKLGYFMLVGRKIS